MDQGPPILPVPFIKTNRSSVPAPNSAKPSSTVPDSTWSTGLAIFAPMGWGKSRLLGRRIVFGDTKKGVGQVIIDTVGATINNALQSVISVENKDVQKALLARLRYCNTSGMSDRVFLFPMLYKRQSSERLNFTAERPVKMLRQIDEKFADASIYGLRRAQPLLRTVCQVLITHNLPISVGYDLLANPKEYTHLIEKAYKNPEAKEGAKELMQRINLPTKTWEERAEPVRNRLSIIKHDIVAQAMFSTSSAPTIDWEEVSRKGLTVFIDLSGPDSESAYEMKLFWILNSILDYVKERGDRGHTLAPFGIVIDELSNFISGTSYNKKEIIADFRQLVTQRMRNAGIWLTCATQEMGELPPEMLSVCMSMGSLMFGATVDDKTALRLARRFDTIDPYKLKDSRPIFGYKPMGYGASSLEVSYYTVTGQQKTFFTFDEQREMASAKYKELSKGDWYLAQAKGEGHVPTTLRRITTRQLNEDTPINGEAVTLLKTRLMQRDALKLEEVIEELEQPGHTPLPDSLERETSTTTAPESPNKLQQSIIKEDLPNPMGRRRGRSKKSQGDKP